MYNPLFLIPVLTGSIFILSGMLMFKFPPKKINWIYGYRTSTSMRNQQRWDFAQVYSSKQMIKIGGLLMLSSLIGIIFKTQTGSGVMLAIGILLIFVVLLLVKVERAIRNKFGK